MLPKGESRSYEGRGVDCGVAANEHMGRYMHKVQDMTQPRCRIFGDGCIIFDSERTTALFSTAHVL